MANPIYELKDVCFSYGGNVVLDQCDFALKEGDFVGVIGPNGAGKSTLLNLMTGYLKPGGGVVYFRGRPLASWKPQHLACHIAVVPQREEGIFPYTVEQVVLMGRYIHQSAPFGFESETDMEIARESIGLVGLEGFADRRVTELSGGELQRVLLARALAQRTSVLLLDEPTSSLDIAHQALVFSLLERLNRELGLTILAISHDINLAALYCPEIAVMGQCKFQFRGTPTEAITAERISDLYGTRVTVGPHESGRPMVMHRR